MRIEGNTIIFKSTPENFIKEKHGLKPNTYRRFTFLREIRDFEDFYKEFNYYVDNIGMLPIKYIKIVNSVTNEEFTRKITDITEFEGVWIISWRNEE